MTRSAPVWLRKAAISLPRVEFPDIAENASNIDNDTVTDTKNHQMWLSSAYAHGERAETTSVCVNLTFANHSDCYLPNKAQSGYFHYQMNSEI